jgi:hypothetical protein
LSGGVKTGYIVNFTTHTSHLHMILSTVGSILQSLICETHLHFLSVFLFIFFDAYYILFYVISLHFFIHYIFSAPPFSTVGHNLVCLVVKLAVVA